MNRNIQQIRRQARVRKKIVGTKDRPRLSVYRSNAAIYAQLIDDTARKTIVGLSQKAVSLKGTKTTIAQALGNALAEKARAKKIKQVVFDKGAYAYHGRVKALAQGAREGGLEF